MDSKSFRLRKPFKEWFAKSKIVDKRGEPLIVFHGTPRLLGFTEFATSSGVYYFSASPEYASWFTVSTGDPDLDRTGAVYPVYLSLQRPKELGEFDIEKLGYEPWMIQSLKSRGYDAAMTYDLRQIVAFDAAKIRFALTEPLFSPEHTRIRSSSP